MENEHDANAPIEDDEEKRRKLARRNRRRLLQVCVLLFCPLLLHSCTLSEMKMSLGPAAPVVVVDMDTNDFLPLGLGEFSPIGLVMNIAVAVGLFYVASVPSARDLLVSASFRYSLYVFLFISNCVLLCPVIPALAYVWHYAVLHPMTIVIQVVRPAVEWTARQITDPGADTAGLDIVAFAISSRIYYALFLLVGTSTPKFLIWFHRKILQPSPDRWWQFSLRGWFALTLLLSLIISVVIWLVRNG